jgi:phosphoribosylformimino-5-aminoimidazole carboxamide ribotide isomerase
LLYHLNLFRGERIMGKKSRSRAQSAANIAEHPTLLPSRTAVSVAVAAALHGAFAMTNVAMAQEDEPIEEIITVGVRMSILDSVTTKRNSDVISDVVDAGALNSLPDQSIADALGRLPGVSTVRDNGQSSQLNIRGMNGDFIQTTLNGREQASTAGYTESTRWMSFDQYPAELITQAAVYKSPKASDIEGGVAGIVDLRTVNPLNAPNQHNFVATARYSTNDLADSVGADDTGSRWSLSYQGKFMDNKFGIAVGYSALEQPNAFQMARAGADDQLGYDQSTDYNGDGSNDYRAASLQWQAGTGTDTRDGFVLNMVFQPTDTLKATFDYFRSEFTREDLRHGITASGLARNQGNDIITNTTITNGVVTGATVQATDPALPNRDQPWFEARTEDQSTQADSDSFGFNLEWNVNDRSTIMLDWSQSEGDKTRKDRLVSMHAYEFDTNGPGTYQEIVGQQLTYSYNGTAIPTGTFTNVDFTDFNSMRMSRYEEYPHEYTDEIDSISLDYIQDVEWGAITSFEVGVRFSDRYFNSDRGTFQYGSRAGQFTGWCDRNMTTGAATLECLPQPLDGFVTVQSTTGLPDYFVVTDITGLGDAIFGPGNYQGGKVWSDNWTFIESGALDEEVQAYYAMVNFDFEWGNIPVSGNFGIRYVSSDVKASGLQQVGAGLGIPITDSVGVTSNDYAPVTYGPDFSDTLPSLNLAFELTDQDILRFAAAEVMGRPPAAQLKGGAGSWNGPGTDYNVWTKGTPYLDPFRATQFDLSYEHYFEDGGAATAAIFWKDISSLIDQVNYNPGTIDFSELGIIIPPGMTPGVYQTWENNDNGGYIRGFELAYTDTFESLPGAFAGLGATVSYSYTDSETEIAGGQFYGQLLPIPGLSENVWTATAFYDWEGFSAYVNWRYRSEFVLNMPIPGSTTPVETQPYTVLDAQVSYSWENGLSVVASGTNLTDEPNVTEYGVAGAFGEYRTFGRQYYIGLNYRY